MGKTADGANPKRSSKEKKEKKEKKRSKKEKQERKRASPTTPKNGKPEAETEPAAKRPKTEPVAAAVAATTTTTTTVVEPMSENKAIKKLTKKLGRAPTVAEVSAYIAKKLRKATDAASTAPAAALADPAAARAAAEPAAALPKAAVGWIDSVGEPPRKNQVPDGKGGWMWPKLPTPTGDGTILLFYGYVTPEWTRTEQDAAIDFAYEVLTRHGCTGRLRVAREGMNGCLTGPHAGIRGFTKELAAWAPEHFGQTDFKYVDKQPDSQMLKELKVFPCTELVTYGFPGKTSASIKHGGNHLKPEDYHKAMTHPNAVMIDVRNFNESVIGKFAPPGTTVLDPMMRKSTEFPKWVDDNVEKLKGKKVLMYCTGGIRCERASAYLIEKGLTDVNQLEGGIHRYLEKYENDGGFFSGKNYTFDKRFSHGAKKADVISTCVLCKAPWDRYAARKKCKVCYMEVIVCRTCDRNDKQKGDKKIPIDKSKLICPLCATGHSPRALSGNQFRRGAQG